VLTRPPPPPSNDQSRRGLLAGLAFDTEINSTKAWVALLALANGVKSRADLLGREAELARERRYAGSKAVDESGRRLDSRGFADAKITLLELNGLQHGLHRRTGRYSRRLRSPTTKDQRVGRVC
jgi:hypothetical protein